MCSFEDISRSGCLLPHVNTHKIPNYYLVRPKSNHVKTKNLGSECIFRELGFTAIIDADTSVWRSLPKQFIVFIFNTQ
jgi:hypothetical protein